MQVATGSPLKQFLEKHKTLRTALLVVVLFGASMVMGDGVLTPAISGGGLELFFPCRLDICDISLIFLDMLNVYRSVQRETLKLIKTFLDKAEDQPKIGEKFVPPMMDPILGDYARNLPDARESEVLSLFATIINESGKKETTESETNTIDGAIANLTFDKMDMNVRDFPVCHTRQL
ncbi:hypothetical protein PVK06_005714 [Gossypium arboreum]|uniref:Exportin-1 C-terminal domain-containing protein n=2 Tax=Gossypium TaxID=3633 RepID=A0ABR0QWJ9_GOSAR|nr:hypothetical protein PVK06_005714 [Gossypium arboreum]